MNEILYSSRKDEDRDSLFQIDGDLKNDDILLTVRKPINSTVTPIVTKIISKPVVTEVEETMSKVLANAARTNDQDSIALIKNDIQENYTPEKVIQIENKAVEIVVKQVKEPEKVNTAVKMMVDTPASPVAKESYPKYGCDANSIIDQAKTRIEEQEKKQKTKPVKIVKKPFIEFVKPAKDIVQKPVKISKGYFDRLVDYIYKSIYKN